MAANPNTQTLKQVWMDQYQISHYKQPVYRAIAEEKTLAGKLKKGDTINWSYMSDFYVEDMGADGSYTTQAQTDTNETLVINQVKDTSFYEFEKDLEQAHYAVKVEYARRAMNKIFLQIDADVLYNAYASAGSIIDAGVLAGGTSNGTAITNSSTTIAALFSYCLLQLQLNNVVYDPNLTFSKEVKLERVEGMPVALISPQMYQSLVLYLGGKTTVLGDKVSVSGHAGAFMSFNLFVTNALTASFNITLAAQPTNGDKFVYNGITFTWVTSGTAAGNIVIGASLAADQANLKSVLNAPFTAITSVYTPVTDNATNRVKLSNIVAGTFASNVSAVYQKGIGSLSISSTLTSASNIFAGAAGTAAAASATAITQHCIFGVSRSVAIVIQKFPSLFVNPVSGKVGKDYVTWCYYGIKVFKYQTTQLLDVQLESSGFTQPVLVTN